MIIINWRGQFIPQVNNTFKITGISGGRGRWYWDIEELKGGQKMEKFWTCLVEGTTGGYGHKHDTFDSAKQEAERLAKMPSNCNRKVYVLGVIGYCEVSEIPVRWTTDIPF